MGYKTCKLLYESNIVPIANYASAICGFEEQQGSRVLFNKVGKFYLGTHIFMPTPALYLKRKKHLALGGTWKVKIMHLCQDS